VGACRPLLRDPHEGGLQLTAFTPDAAATLAGPAWLRAARQGAAERFASATLPTDAEEVWRYSRIAELDLDAYTPVQPHTEPAEVPPAAQALLDAIGPTSGLIITRNGQPVLAHGAVSAAGEEPIPIGEIAGEPDALTALNAAFVEAPLTVKVEKGRVLPHPVVVFHWIDADGRAIFPRTVVNAEEGAEARVVEVFASSDVASLVVPVTELAVAQGARLRYVNVQTLGEQVWQIGLQASRVGRDADLISHSIAFGGDYARVRTDSTLAGQGGSSRLLAMYFGAGRQMHDFRTLQAHDAKKTTSDLLFKGAVANSSHSVYSGLIRVRKGAAGTNAFQTNRNLVLDEGAHADSVPNLEIEENDVRCSHASAVGPIDEEQRFYLESRGVPTDVADRLIVVGFLEDVLVRVPVPSLLPWLRPMLAKKLERVEAVG
jgi:Fe-S cluster assembly protein SufD